MDKKYRFARKAVVGKGQGMLTLRWTERGSEHPFPRWILVPAAGLLALLRPRAVSGYCDE